MSLSMPSAALLSLALIAPPAIAAQRAAGQAATSERRADEVTVSGCLQQQPAVTGAPVGHESGAAAGILLTTAPAASTRSGAPAAAPKPADSYLIAGTRAQELSRYVGEIVEVSGTLDSDIASDAGRAPTTATSSPKPIARHTIAVTAFRATGMKCK
jgi:hypothetical protein